MSVKIEDIDSPGACDEAILIVEEAYAKSPSYELYQKLIRLYRHYNKLTGKKIYNIEKE